MPPKNITKHGVRVLCESLRNEKVSIILQIYKIKQFGQQEKVRMRFYLNDGISSVLATIIKSAFDSNSPLPYKDNDIIEVTNYRKQMLHDKTVLNFTERPKVMISGVKSLIGDPRLYDQNRAKHHFPQNYDTTIPITDEDQALLEEQARIIKQSEKQIQEEKVRKTPTKMNSDLNNRNLNYNNINNGKNTSPNSLSASTNDTPSSIKIIRKGNEQTRKAGRPKSFIGTLLQKQEDMMKISPSNLDISLDDNEYVPIKCLNPFLDDWRIKARVISRSQLRPYNGRSGQGKIFNAQLMDQYNTRIQASFFNESAQTWDQFLEASKVYTWTGGRVKMANRKFTSIDNDYCLYFNNTSVIQEIKDDGNISTIGYSFKTIKEANQGAIGQALDIIGVVQDVAPPVDLTTKAGKQLTKLEIVINDDGMQPIAMTIFGEQCQEIFDELRDLGNPVVGFKDARINEYNGRQLTLNRYSTIIIDPGVERTQILKSWWNKVQTENIDLKTVQHGAPNKKRSEYLTLDDIVRRESRLINGMDVQGEFYNVNGLVRNIPTPDDRLYYMACGNNNCKKKVQAQPFEEKSYFCELCARKSTDPQPMYTFTVKIEDTTASIYAQVYKDVGEKILGVPAMQIHQIVAHADDEQREQKIREIKNKSRFKGQSKVRYNIYRCSEPNIIEENDSLIKRMRMFTKNWMGQE